MKIDSGEPNAATEHLLSFQANVLEMIATGRQLVPILNAIAEYIESQCENIRCSVALIDAELRLRPASAPNLPAKYNGALDGVPIYPYIGPCGLAAYQKQQIISQNIAMDNRWSEGFRSLTKELGLKACWSTPVCDSRGRVIATFALYCLHAGTPNSQHLQLIEIATRLAGIAIERQLREERLRLCAEIISRSAEAIRILDPSGKIVEQNVAHRELFGVSDEILLGKTSSIIFGEEQFKEISESIAAGKNFSGELMVTIKAEQRIIDVSLIPVRDETGKIVCYASLNRDVTETRRIQEELQKSHAQLEARVQARTSQLQRLSARLMTAQDEERRRIARELHDSAGQYLAAIKMNLSALRESTAAADSDEPRIIDSLDMAEHCMTEIRTMSYLLHPPLLDEVGLRSAILSYIEGFAQRSGIKVDVNIPADLTRLSVETETAVFRVIQQSLANIHRHSESRVAEIRFWEESRRLRVEIRDEGVGICPEKLADFRSGKQPTGVGIAGMRERIGDLGGDFDIRSDPTGTTVEISLPISRNAEAPNISRTATPCQNKSLRVSANSQ
jgi:PAS domain S-box-containing protein